jgi:hypothetical protein
MPSKRSSAENLKSASDNVVRFAREPSTGSRAATSALPPDGLDFRAAREEMIRVAAYYIAEQRGFVPGAELEDWLIAESEIDALLNE